MKLAINLVTRGRPAIALNTIARTAGNIRRTNTVFMVSMDADDHVTVDAIHAPGLFLSIREREDSIGAKWNRVLTDIPDADVYLSMSDDSPVITPGFDERIIEAASHWPDRIGMVIGYLAGITTCSCQAVTRQLADLMGCIYPECFPFWFTDPWLLEIVRHTDRLAFADVQFDHSLRLRTMERREPTWWAALFDACRFRRRAIAHRIIDQLDEPEWRKAILKARHPLVEAFARNASDNIRQLDQCGDPPDARYLRIKAAAIEILREVLPDLRAHQHEPLPEKGDP